MFDHVSRRIPPVVEDLRTKDMPSNSPYTLVVLLSQPLMAQLLGVKVVYLKGAVMYMGGVIRAHEETVMVDQVCTAIDVCKQGNIDCLFSLFHSQEIRGHDVEGGRVEIRHSAEVLNTESKVSQLSYSLVIHSPGGEKMVNVPCERLLDPERTAGTDELAVYPVRS